MNLHQVSTMPYSIGLEDEVTIPVQIPGYIASDRDFKVRGFAGTFQNRDFPYQGLGSCEACGGDCQNCSRIATGMGMLHLLALGAVVWWMAKEHGTWRY